MIEENSPEPTSPAESTNEAQHTFLPPTCNLVEDPLVTRLVCVLDEYLEDLKAGKAVSREELLAAHPDLEERLRSYLAGIDFLNPAAEEPSDPQGLAARQLGDFRIGREIGRGGMGAVYEAEQISLARRVALKVLRFGSVSDPQAIGRFQREAETIANLHHTHIVPIFSVGSEQGVNYYAMQYIDGQSLDKVLQRDDREIDQRLIARWGLEAAEALAHAHGRNVIHRDVKPSNLILDQAAGQIWLTDFGLAKRLDDVTLSMTGALLGTPRYMSPEQADATRRSVDHRTDLYSLGATLYELLTRAPVFDAATPHEVLHQIMAEPPQKLQTHRASIDRDVDTIVMKCLAKDPAQRYQTAQALADDLRAYLDGRPIQARRASIVEGMLKSLKRRRQSVALSVSTFLAATVIFATSLISYYGYQHSQLARLNLQTDTPPLIAELMNQNGDQLTGPQTLPTQQPLDIPSGEIEVLVSGGGQLSQTFRTSLPPGQIRQFEVDLTDSQIGPSIRFDRALRLIRVPASIDQSSDVITQPSRSPHLPSRLRAVLLDNEGVAVKPLVASEPTISRRIPNQLDPATNNPPVWIGDAIGFRWWTDFSPQSRQSGYDKFDLRPFIVGQVDDSGDELQFAPDLDGDSVADVVIAARHQAWLLALSGKDLSTIWFASRAIDVSASSGRSDVLSATISPPMTAGDLNDDGVTDLIAIFADVNDDQNARRWIEAISGSDGATIWKSEMAARWFVLPGGRETPYAFRWFVRGSQGSSSGGGGGWSNHHGIVTRSHQFQHTRHGPFVPVPDRARLVGSQVLCLAGNRLLSIDTRTGMLTHSEVSEVIASQGVKWADVDGDGSEDALLVEYLGDQQAAAGYPPAPVRVPRARIAAWSMARDQLLWQQDITVREPQRAGWSIEPPDWPVVADLDGDGASEVIVPNGTSDQTKRMADVPWGSLEVFDGRTGKPIWSRRIPGMDQWSEYLAAGPDVDGDAVRDVFTASLWSDQYVLYVDCLSGADGHLLWQSHRKLHSDPSDSTEFVITQIAGWDNAVAGSPAVMVTTDSRHAEDVATAHVFSAVDGKLSHLVREADQVLVSDADGDGIDDLAIVHDQPEQLGRDGGGQLNVVRGFSSEQWRRLASESVPAADYDGDAIRDLLVHDSGSLYLYSGATGDLVWQSTLPRDMNKFVLAQDPGTSPLSSVREMPFCGGAPTAADLNGDGSPDLVICNHRGMAGSLRPLIALSGSSGKRLWTADLELQNIGGVLALDVNDLDDDGNEEVMLLAALDLGYPRGQFYSSANQQLWIFVFAGGSGRLKWKQPLSPAYGSNANSPYRFDRGWVELRYGDFNGDGVIDLLLPADSATAPGRNLELRALSGTDGKQLWASSFPDPQSVDEVFKRLLPSEFADLDGDGRLEVIQPGVTTKGNSTVLRIRVLEGSSGKERWQWESPVDVDFDRVDLWPQDWFSRPRPVIAQRGNGTCAIAMLTHPPDRSVGLVVIDSHGNTIANVALAPSRSALRDHRQRVLTSDIDGDGSDELILRKAEGLFSISAAHPDNPAQRITELDSGDRVLGLLPGTYSPGTGHWQAATVLIAAARGDNSVRGLDAETGKVRWLCAGPTPRKQGSPLQVNDVTLLSPPDASPQLVSFAYDNVLLCRHAASVDRPLVLASKPDDRFTAQSSAMPVRDPRWVRPLPWTAGKIDLPEILRIFAWMSFYCLTLLLLPVGYVGYLVRDRRFGLKQLLMAPVVVSIAMMGVTLPGPEEQVRDLVTKLSLATMALAPLVAAALMIYWCVVRRWRTVLFWIGTSVLISAVMFVVVVFVIDSGMRGKPLPEEQWSYGGWYLVWFPAAVATSWVLLISIVLRPIVSRVRAWFRRSAAHHPASAV